MKIKKECKECVNFDSSICIYKCSRKNRFEQCQHNCRCCKYYGECNLLNQLRSQG